MGNERITPSRPRKATNAIAAVSSFSRVSAARVGTFMPSFSSVILIAPYPALLETLVVHTHNEAGIGGPEVPRADSRLRPLERHRPAVRRQAQAQVVTASTASNAFKRIVEC